MKNNIDLTEDRLFSRSRILDDMALSVLTLSMLKKGKFPWDIGEFRQIRSYDELDMEHQRNSLITLGDKGKRAEIAEYRKMDSANYCDCCGSRMNLKPWDREVGICHKCNNYYEKEVEKCKWRKKEDIRNAVILIA